ncbi:MAG: hypothetical protein KKA65_00955 [Nanoarchaeota archaeon]|nr:hypothetical protein [Nanoarchaeota archaeon]MBU4242359.1 hypothetical protein [Nanoarchaeota archaeon]MBU4352731.1 hypothetical protein [Nanoarchaeota archaeon]MBU4456047.1 hypothetical protein [Nanoarchaeota archaeon]MCG2720118.1 hypothetical protein [Nanoarchaeota archaeon]
MKLTQILGLCIGLGLATAGCTKNEDNCQVIQKGVWYEISICAPTANQKQFYIKEVWNIDGKGLINEERPATREEIEKYKKIQPK